MITWTEKNEMTIKMRINNSSERNKYIEIEIKQEQKQ